MEKSYAELLFEQGLEKGLERGAIQSKQEAVLRVLRKRGFAVDKALETRVKDVEDLGKLDELLDAALDCSTLEEFLEGLS